MTVVRVPTPLRPYTDGQKEVLVGAETVGKALDQLTEQYPALRQHLYDDTGGLRPYVNLFLNEEDVRGLDGQDTSLSEGDRLTIVPSIAGGAGAADDALRNVDHAALRTNQAMIIGLLLAAFIADASWLVALVALVMFIGTLAGRPGFLPIYRALRKATLLQPDVVSDHPEPHRFAQGVGAIFLAAAMVAFSTGLIALGWGLGWLVIALAALNLFGGFCVGCAAYYWLGRLGIPGFSHAPPPGTLPGQRPRMTG